jgi:hypothetical protein
VSEGSWVTYRFGGVEFDVCENAGAWHVRHQGDVVVNRYLDHALGTALGLRRSEVLGWVRKILEERPRPPDPASIQG